MFRHIRHRLLISYLAVLVAILAVFAVAVRLVFMRSLQYQLTERLVTLGQSVAATADYENGALKLDDDADINRLVARHQAFQWFDQQGRLIKQQGKDVLTLPLAARQSIQIQASTPHLFSVIVPIIDSDTNKISGYVRVSESMQESDQTLRNLDLGLGGGIVVALALGSLGGSWLTRQAMQPIEQSFRRLQQFTADASHELRSPLMAIKSNAAVALRYPSGMRALDAEKFEAIAGATSQMTRLTEDLLFLARHDQMPQRAWKPVDLTQLLNDLVQFYQPQAVAKPLDLKLLTSRPETGYVMGDKAQLTRLFTNLISNALHYTPTGGTVEITVSQAVYQPVYIDVSVRDTGIGIAAEHLNHLFDRFWRADFSRTHWEGGSGLGLSIAQSIAQTHGGKISVTSQLSNGSCFTVRLPVNERSG